MGAHEIRQLPDDIGTEVAIAGRTWARAKAGYQEDAGTRGGEGTHRRDHTLREGPSGARRWHFSPWEGGEARPEFRSRRAWRDPRAARA